MDLLGRFKKDYFNYLISIILPAIITGISIPLFKHLLGAKGYGEFSLWFNAVLIITAISTGWITQSILRFYPNSNNKISFAKRSINLTFLTQLLFAVPFIIGFLIFSHNILLTFICLAALFSTSIQFTITPLIQSAFLSKKIIYSEIIRVSTYILLSVFFLQLTGLYYLYSLLIAVIISYIFSIIYLVKASGLSVKHSDYDPIEHINFLFKKFFRYGAPLSMWFVFAYLLSYIDKVFILKKFGGEIQGNYQAIFDLISKSIILVISPAISSIFPILTSAYVKGNNSEIRKLLKRIIVYELLAFMAVSAGYWSFGASLLFKILKVPHTSDYSLMGFLVIAGVFIWQIGILIQMRFELKLQSLFLLAMVIIAFFAQLIFYLIFEKYNSVLVYPLGFLGSAVVYVCLISISELKILRTRVTANRKLKSSDE